MKRILIAGIGNIFCGDDAFGVEVVRALEQRPLPEAVTVRDFGIRGYDLACALGDGYDAVILVDATPCNEVPGTVYLIEPDQEEVRAAGGASIDGHSLEPVRALQMAAALGGIWGRLYLVGCEPAELESPDGRIGLSDAVQSAVPKAVELIERLAGELLDSERSINTGAVPAGKETCDETNIG